MRTQQAVVLQNAVAPPQHESVCADGGPLGRRGDCVALRREERRVLSQEYSARHVHFSVERANENCLKHVTRSFERYGRNVSEIIINRGATKITPLPTSRLPMRYERFCPQRIDCCENRMPVINRQVNLFGFLR